LDTIIEQAESILPSLREDHAEAIREFEEEQRIAAEIENCDQEYLSELKTTLAEQGNLILTLLEADEELMWSSSAALDEFRAEVAEANAKLERLEDKLRDLEIEQSETKASMEASQRTLHIQTNSTQAEALRLKGTLSLEEVLDAISHPCTGVQMNSPLWKTFISGTLARSMPISSNLSMRLVSTSTFLASSSSH
jgi:chromosome segregation ATPase